MRWKKLINNMKREKNRTPSFVGKYVIRNI